MNEIKRIDPSGTGNEPQWLGLAFSGGGFRATLFHLGLIRLLRECGLLDRVRLICSVSAGSILAAHLGLNWSSYTGDDLNFHAAEKEILGFIQSDVRNTILRKWFCERAYLVPYLVAKAYGEQSGFTALLASSLDKLYRSANFQDLHSRAMPALHILCTSLTTGALCKFTNHGFEVVDADRTHGPILTDSIKISLGVACSAAFPPLFEPVPINHKVLNCDRKDLDRDHVVADGGIFDNLGILELARLVKESPERGLLIVSNASANVDWEVRKKYSSLLSIIPRSVRANNIMMSHFANLALQPPPISSHQFCRVDMHTKLDPSSERCALTGGEQTIVRNAATDLDSFSDAEALALIRHGYAESRIALRRAQIPSPTLWDEIESLRFYPPVASMKLEILSKRRWRRLLFAPKQPSFWLSLLALLLWPTLLWFGGSAYSRHEVKKQRAADLILFREEEKESRRREQTETFGIQENRSNNPAVVSTIAVTNARDGHPVPDARVEIEIENADATKHRGITDRNGLFRFRWDSKDRFATTRVSVYGQDYLKATDTFELGEKPTLPVELNRRD